MLYSISIVEDEPITAEYIKQVVEKTGSKVISVTDNVIDALYEVSQNRPDIIFIDINLRGSKDGIYLANEVNKLEQNIKIIFITAYGDTETVSEAARTFPVNFLLKPFTEKDIEITLSLVLAKLASEKRTEAGTQKKILQLSPVCYYCYETKTVFRNFIPVKLSAKEYKLMIYFCERPNRLVTHEELFGLIWTDKDIAESTLRDLIYRLRRRIPELDITSISSIGYRMIIS